MTYSRRMDDVTRYLLKEAAQEIRSLRQRNEVLGSQVAVIEVFRMALMKPVDHSPMCRDICHDIDVELAKDAEKRGLN
jgi:hypothetical protein